MGKRRVEGVEKAIALVLLLPVDRESEESFRKSD
jgi:hypothetical protein